MVENLIEMGILKGPNLVKETRVLRVAHAYPVPIHQRPTIVQHAQAWLAEYNIFPVGRFGECAYINSNEALHRGLQVGELIQKGDNMEVSR